MGFAHEEGLDAVDLSLKLFPTWEDLTNPTVSVETEDGDLRSSFRTELTEWGHDFVDDPEKSHYSQPPCPCG